VDVRDLSGRSALVTGAASGIGRATALECARRGADLFLCDLNEAGLEQTAAEARGLGREVLARRVDVASAVEMRAFADEVHGRREAVDLLVNNAGVAIAGGLIDTTLEDWEWIIGVNLRGVVHGCHFFVPPMVRRGSGGHVVIVSSAAGYSASDGLVAYCTTKFAVLGLAEALCDELRRNGIGVTAICPGIIDTPITGSARLRGEYAAPGARELMVERYRRRGYGPDRVAAGILSAVQRERVVAPVSPEARVLYWLARFTPGLERAVRRGVMARGRRQIEKIRDAAGA
jgi:NAD(P)-dependent dehydrogenase (short-subunit alcohol dehydrogenase family)